MLGGRSRFAAKAASSSARNNDRPRNDSRDRSRRRDDSRDNNNRKRRDDSRGRTDNNRNDNNRNSRKNNDSRNRKRSRSRGRDSGSDSDASYRKKQIESRKEWDDLLKTDEIRRKQQNLVEDRLKNRSEMGNKVLDQESRNNDNQADNQRNSLNNNSNDFESVNDKKLLNDQKADDEVNFNNMKRIITKRDREELNKEASDAKKKSPPGYKQGNDDSDHDDNANENPNSMKKAKRGTAGNKAAKRARHKAKKEAQNEKNKAMSWHKPDDENEKTTGLVLNQKKPTGSNANGNNNLKNNSSDPQQKKREQAKQNTFRGFIQISSLSGTGTAGISGSGQADQNIIEKKEMKIDRRRLCKYQDFDAHAVDGYDEFEGEAGGGRREVRVVEDDEF